MTGGKKQALHTMLHPSIRFSGSSMEGNSAIRGESIVGEAIPWNGRCNNWNLMTIKKKSLSKPWCPPRQVSTGFGVPDTSLLLWVSKMHHGVVGSWTFHSGLADSVATWAEARLWGVCRSSYLRPPTPSWWGEPNGEGLPPRLGLADTEDSELTSGEKKLNQTKHIYWLLNRNTPPLVTRMPFLVEA